MVTIELGSDPLPEGPNMSFMDKAKDKLGRTLLDVGTRMGDDGSGDGALARPKELLHKGEDAAESVNHISDTIGDVSEAVSAESSMFGKIKAAVQALGGGSDPGDEKKLRLIIQEQIDVGVPAQRAYDTWSDFGQFDEVFRAIESADHEGDEDEGGEDEGGESGEGGGEVKFQAKILFSRREWTSEITDQTPGRRIAWKSSGDVDHVGAVSFHELTDSLTRIHVEMEYQPTGIVEKFGNLFLTVRHRVRKDLRLFKHHLELQSQEDQEVGKKDQEEVKKDQEDQAGRDDASGGYEDMSRDELREELQGRELSVAGKKSELVERLEADDRGESDDD
jgi:uncharacterized membrane protein